MYLATNDAVGAFVQWTGQTRGGGSQPVGFLIEFVAGSVSGGGDLGVRVEVEGSGTGGAKVWIIDDGSVSVSRLNSTGGTSTSASSAGVLSAGGPWWLWVDMPTAMLTGTNPTVWHNSGGSWQSVTVSGATSPGGSADDLTGVITANIGDTGAGVWKFGNVIIFQGVDRPTNAAMARAVALNANPVAQALQYTGCCFAWSANNLEDSKFSVNGSNTGGEFEVVAPTIRGGHMLNSTCTVSRPSQSRSSDTGGFATTFVTYEENVPCMVQDAGSRESLVGYRQTGGTSFRVYFEYGRDVRNGDRIVWDGRTLSVVGPPVSDPMRAHYTMVPCEEQQGGGLL